MIASLSLVALAAPMAPVQGTPIPGNIVEVAQQNGNFNTLVTALQLTGLDAALDGSSGPQRLTVFAPTDAAFSALDPALLNALLNDIPALTQVLLYHVVGDGLVANDVLASTTIDTLNGQRVGVSVQALGAFIDQALIEQTNVFASNGVIHVLGDVLVPNLETIVATALGDPNADYLTHLALQVPGLVAALDSAEFTVFAPENAAFQQFPAATLRTLVTPQGIATLQTILEVHVVPGRLFSDQLIAAGQVTSLQGKVLDVVEQGGNVFVDGALVFLADVQCANGNIHFIDTVLLP